MYIYIYIDKTWVTYHLLIVINWRAVSQVEAETLWALEELRQSATQSTE